MGADGSRLTGDVFGRKSASLLNIMMASSNRTTKVSSAIVSLVTEWGRHVRIILRIPISMDHNLGKFDDTEFNLQRVTGVRSSGSGGRTAGRICRREQAP